MGIVKIKDLTLKGLEVNPKEYFGYEGDSPLSIGVDIDFNLDFTGQVGADNVEEFIKSRLEMSNDDFLQLTKETKSYLFFAKCGYELDNLDHIDEKEYITVISDSPKSAIEKVSKHLLERHEAIYSLSMIRVTNIIK